MLSEAKSVIDKHFGAYLCFVDNVGVVDEIEFGLLKSKHLLQLPESKENELIDFIHDYERGFLVSSGLEYKLWALKGAPICEATESLANQFIEESFLYFIEKYGHPKESLIKLIEKQFGVTQ